MRLRRVATSSRFAWHERLPYEEVYLNAYATVAEAKTGIGAWLSFYNDERQHQSLGYRTPRHSRSRQTGSASASARHARRPPGNGENVRLVDRRTVGQRYHCARSHVIIPISLHHWKIRVC